MRKFVKKIPILIVTMLIVMLSLVSVFSVSAITAEEIKNTYGIPDWLWNQVPQDYKERLEELLPEDFTLPGDIEIPELPEDFQLPEDFVFPELPENKEDFNVDDYIKNLADEVKEHFKTEYLADRQYYKIAYKANVLDLVVKDNFTRPESGFKSLLLDVYTDAVQALTAASVDNKFTLLAALQNGVDTAAVKEILNSIKSVSVDGLVIYDGSVRTDSIKALVKRLPLPSEIATYTDEQFRNLLSVDVKVVTESRGNLDITVNFGFEFANANNYARLRRIAQIVADNVSVSHKDGVYSVSVNVPQAFTRILNKAIATGKLSDSAKLKIFAALDKNVNEFAEFAKTITFEQVYNLLEKIDIVSCIDNTRLGKYFPDGITNERILNEFKKIEPYFEKIKTALIELVTFVPQRFQSKTMMDFYRGNGEFFAAKYNYELFVETWLYRIQSKGLAVTDYIKNTYTDSRILKWNSRLEKALNKLPMLSMFFNRESYMVSAEASVTLTDVYKVTYKDGENVIKCGLLPKDADLSFFAGITEISGSEILDWVDENGNSISKMPERDAEVYAVYDAGFKLEQSADIDTVYDGEAKQLKVNVVNLSSIEKTYDFGWYKIVGDSRVAIDGAYSDTLEVRNVLDSGKYICVVASGDTVKEAVFNVAIAKAKIDMTGVKWSYTAPFTYDGEIKTVSLNKEIEQLRFVGRLSARDVGTFNVSFELIDADNYELINLGDLSASLEWKIEKIKVDMTGVKWSYTAPFTYDGTTKTVSLVKAPSLVEVKGTLSATKAGTYTASFALKDTEHYELINLGDLATFLEWKIEKAKVDMTGVKWSYTAPFTYDGTTKTVSLVKAPSLVEVKGTLSATKAGTYTASFALKDTENYEMVNAGALASSLEWKINKASVDLAGAAWDYTAPFTYDGTIKTVSLTMQFDKLKFSGNSATDAGTYTASFELKDAENYEIINKGSLSDSIEWKINKADIDMSAVARSFVDAEFVYDGKPHTLAVDSKLLPNGVKVKGYLGSAVTHVSESPKTITVQFELLAEKAVNYNVPADMSATVTVVAKEIGLKWENLKFTYDGSSHVPTATATGLVGNDTCKVTVYGAQTEVGVYTATAVSVDNADYKLPGSVTVSFEIEAASVIVPVTKIDPITGTTVTSTVLGNEMTMDVSDVTKDNKNIDVSKFAEKDKVAKILYVYEISFKIGNNVCKLENGNYEVSLVIPDGEAGKTYKVVVIDKNGNVTEINGTVSADGKSVKFNVTNLDGKFSLLEVEDKEVSELVEHAGVIVGVGSAVIVVFSAAALYFVVFRKKKRI
ncbi:putative uncharacterized protein [Firmicutes bacterium CAG:552]|nr:putative uncharacterized protein [Firmicutes bacterium CAG:552]